MSSYQVSRERGAKFCPSRREAAETACEWARTYTGEIAIWSVWWISPETRKPVTVIVFPGDSVSTIEGHMARMDDRFVPKPPQGPKGGESLPLRRAA